MKKNPIGPLAAGCLLLIFGGCKKNGGADCSSCSTKSFTMFNSIHFNNTPDLTSQGVHDFDLVYSGHILTQNPNNPKDQILNLDSLQVVANVSLTQPTVPVSIDIEVWSYSASQLDTTINRYLALVQAFRQMSGSKLGFYGVVPHDAFTWQNISPVGGTSYLKWQALNDSLAPIARVVDMFFPSFYTFDNDTSSWDSYVTSTLSETHRYSRNIPIYAYVWPQYHDGSANQYAFVDTAVWRYELETLYQQTDGIVIWTGDKDSNLNPITWDDNMAWWQTTLSFIQEHHIH